LSLEQADLVARFMAMSESEHEYFLLMVNHERAGTAPLKRHFEKQLAQLKKKVEQISELVPKSQREQLSGEEQALYYSSWIYAAVHMAVTLQATLTAKELGEKLQLSETHIQTILRQLETMGLLTYDGDRWVAGRAQIHLGHESPLLALHHRNLRDFSNRPRSSHVEDLRYSSFVTLSEADAERIRSELLKILAEHRARIQVSPEQTMYCYNLDFFAAVD
jgi:uncharacterized protein (TIGR02147 family)